MNEGTKIQTDRYIDLERLEVAINGFREAGYTKERIICFLDLAKKLIEEFELNYEHPKLVTSFGWNHGFSVNILNRLVIMLRGKLHDDGHTGGIIMPLDFHLNDDNSNKLSIPIYRSSYYSKNNQFQARWFYFSSTYYCEMINNSKVVEEWLKAVREQLGRGTRSSVKRFHRRVVYDLIMDLEFRNTQLNNFFKKQGHDNPQILIQKAMEQFPAISYIDSAVNRKGQVILYGPPGTGKTYVASMYAIYKLLLFDQRFDDLTKLLENPENLGSFDKLYQKEGRISFLTFHPSYGYEDFIEGFRPVQTDNKVELRLVKGIFRRICEFAQQNTGDVFLIIDEINRAHLTKVFGELITLLEMDKRGRTSQLLYSKELFFIPPNVKIIGTMNTSDFSVKSLDIALRRRFGFVEVSSDPQLLEDIQIGELELDSFLTELNRRILNKFGREKQIGHSYFMNENGPIETIAQFHEVFSQDIIRLLEEYCHQNYLELVELVGPELIDQENHRLSYDIIDDPEKLINCLVKEFQTALDRD